MALDVKGGETQVIRRICNPADAAELVAELADSTEAEVDGACERAAAAFPAWRATPPPDRAAVRFRYRQLLLEHFDELARLIVRENGKLLSEARGSLRRGVDVVEFACGIPSQLMGRVLPEIARNLDSYVVHEPLGVVAGIPPFNFPAMIPLWMMPIAVACGNTFVLKPAEKAPLTATRLADLFVQAGLPPGVVSVVQVGREVSERLIEHRAVQGVSFVGSSAVAAQVYRRAATQGKRVQARGGAKNYLIVLPDADLPRSLPALVGSCFGCAGQRCLAGSVLLAVGDRARQDAVRDAFVQAARELKLGDGLDESVTMGPVVNDEQRRRIIEWIDCGEREGATLLLDGGRAAVPDRPRGCFVGATIFDRVSPAMAIVREEIFGPVVGVLRAGDLDEALTLANRSRYGNSVSLLSSRVRRRASFAAASRPACSASTWACPPRWRSSRSAAGSSRSSAT
jgi:malonate-semialdehyde dehydrogenase (acetylating)/methylmalonate-semialdehyde dehydrogenase